MENLREDFILDNNPGDFITVLLTNGQEWTGTIIDWNERRVRLEMNGVPRTVSFNIIDAYYPAEPVPAAPAPRKAEPAPAPRKPEPVLTPAQIAVQKVASAEYRIAFDPDMVTEKLRLAPNTMEKERITALFHNFLKIDAADPLAVKRVMNAAEKLLAQYSESALTCNVIGEISMKVGNWEQAEDCFYEAGSYARAFYAAMQLQSEDKVAEDGARHLLDEDKKAEEVVFTFVRLAAKAGDLSVFRRFQREESDRFPQLVAECLCWLLNNAGLALPEGENIAEPTVIDAMAELFDRYYPDPADSQMKRLESDEEEEPAEEENAPAPVPEKPEPVPEKPLPTGLTGYIYGYDSSRRIGRIHNEDCPSWFFHYNHIIDPLLQGMLDTEPGRRYLVTFDVGVNAHGQCASNIRLTDPENPVIVEERQTGVITRFYPNYMNGQITSGEESFNFRVNEISDTALRDYCTIFSDVVLRKFTVTYQVRLLPTGKRVAVDIKPETPFSDAEIRMINEQLEAERNRRGVISRYYPTQQQGMITDGATDYHFALSDVTDPDLRSALEHLPDPGSHQFRVKFAATHRAGSAHAEDVRLIDPLGEQDRLHIERQAQPGKSDNPFAQLPPWPAGESRDGLYLRAQQERLKGDPSRAVSHYITAIRAQDRLESSICDLVSLYLQLRQDDNAILLMKAYEWVLPEEKAINNWISIYDRTKSDDPLLLSLYERILSTPLKVNTKLHYLVKKAQLLTRMGRYTDSMDTYAVWETLAAQAERGFMGSTGWEQVAISDGLRSLIARGRAICLYHLGQREEAKAIAAKLFAQNPADTAAKQILEGRLENAAETALGDQQQDLTVSAYENLHPYVRELLDQLSFQKVARIRSIENDKFTGNVRQAAEDLENYERLAAGTAPQARSDRMLTAAKLVLRCLQKKGSAFFQEKELSKFSESYFESLLGSGLCSYGDALLQESKPAPSVRYHYLQALNMMTPNANEGDRINAVTRYIATYFLTGNRLLEFGKYRGEMDRCLRLFSEQSCIDVGGFVCGLFFLLEKAASHKSAVLSGIYASPLRDEVTDLLKQTANLPASVVDSESGFFTLWEQASGQWLRAYRSFCGDFSSRTDFLSSARIEALKQTIQNERSACLPDDADRQTLDEFTQVLNLFERLGDTTEFDMREQILRSIGDRCSDLSNRISRNPTAFTYDVLRSAVNLAAQLSSRKLEESYNESRPNLTITADAAVTPASDRRFSLPLFLENGRNLQTADNLQIQVEPEQGVQYLEDMSTRIRHVKGGTEESCILFFAIGEDDPRTAFSVTVTVSYEYRENGAVRTGSQKQVFPVSINTADVKPIKNPFRAHANQQEVTDLNMFFGRDKDIEDIIRIISDEDGKLVPKKSVALYGQKRTGKSSLLYHVKQRIRRDFSEAIILDLGSLGSYIPDDRFYQSIMANILYGLENATDDNDDFCQLLEDYDLTIPCTEISVSPNYAIVFRNFLNRLERVIEQSGAPYRFVIFIDEFTHLYNHIPIQNGEFVRRFLRFWRESVHDHGWISIIVGQDSMESLRSEYSNELGATAMFPVTYLKPEEAARMIREPIGRENPEVRFSDQAVSRLVELTAGSAYLLMILCAELVDYLNEVHHSNVIPAHIDQLVDRVFSSNAISETHFDPLYDGNITLVRKKKEDGTEEAVLESRREENKKLLTELASRTYAGSAFGTSREQLTADGMDPQLLDSLLQSLVARGVLEMKQGQYRIIVRLYHEWLLYRYGPKN